MWRWGKVNQSVQREGGSTNGGTLHRQGTGQKGKNNVRFGDWGDDAGQCRCLLQRHALKV